MKKCKTFFKGVAVIATCLLVALASTSCSGSDDDSAFHRDLSTAQVGDVIFKSGKVLSASEIELLRANTANAIAVIYKIDAANKKAWAVGKVHEELAWAKNDTQGCKDKINALGTIIDNVDEYKSSYTIEPSFSIYLDGSKGLEELQKVVTDYSAENYPAWAWCENYGNEYCKDTDFTTGWYFPTVAELYEMYQNESVVNKALEKSGGNKFDNHAYFSSSNSVYDEYVYTVSFPSGYVDVNGNYYKGNKDYICAVRQFTW